MRQRILMAQHQIQIKIGKFRVPLTTIPVCSSSNRRFSFLTKTIQRRFLSDFESSLGDCVRTCLHHDVDEGEEISKICQSLS